MPFDTARSYQRDHRIPVGVQTGTWRPPSEASSMLLLVAESCPYNQCKFCGFYPGQKYKPRPLDTLKAELDAYRDLYARQGILGEEQRLFLQDGNAVAAPTKTLTGALKHAGELFKLERVTSYGSSLVIARKPKGHLPDAAEAGLTRIHVGMETCNDNLLRAYGKGTTYEEQVKAGKRVMAAGIILSEYVLFSLGGKRESEAHIRDTARALSEIQPDVIRARRFVGRGPPKLGPVLDEIGFEPLGDREVIQEWRMLIELFEGTSFFTTDNFHDPMDLHGKLPDDREEMLDTIDTALEKWF